MRLSQLWKEPTPRASYRDFWQSEQAYERRCSPLLMLPEFDKALKAAEQGNTGAYIEVVTDTYAASPLCRCCLKTLRFLALLLRVQKGWLPGRKKCLEKPTPPDLRGRDAE